MELLGEEKRMTVKEMAEALKVSEQTIRYHVKRMFPDIVQNGLATLLNEEQATAIKRLIGTGRNDLPNIAEVKNISTAIDIEEMTVKVIQYHMAEAARLRKENASLNGQLAIAAPKAEFYDQVVDSKDAIDMRTAAAVLNIPGLGRNKLFDRLRALGVLDQDNKPYRKFQDAGYFRVIETKYTDQNGDTHINTKTLVYQRGIDFIRKAVKNG